MSDTEQEGAAGQAGSALRRKALAGRPAGARPGEGAARALRLALARAGQAVPGLDLRVTDLADNRHALAELLDMVPELALLAVLEGPAEGLGLVALAPPVLSGIVEVQTTGRLATDERPPRKPTRTDAAMTVELIDKALSELQQELAGTPDIVWAGGFHFASFLDDPRPLGLLLEDIAYRVFTLSVRLGDGGRSGTVLLALPAEGRAAPPAEAAPTAATPDARARQQWTQALEEAVMGAEAEVAAVLHRLRVPLSALMGLRAGDMIPVPAVQLERIELEAIDGRRLGAGRLGQNRGMRAVRLAETPQSQGNDAAPDLLGAPMAGLAPPPPEAGFPAPDPIGANPLPDMADPLPLPGEDGDPLPMAMPMGLDDLGGGLGDGLGALPGDGADPGLDLPLPEPLDIPLPDPLAPGEDPLDDLPPMPKVAGAS